MKNASFWLGWLALLGLVTGEFIWGERWIALTYLIAGILVWLYLSWVEKNSFQMRVLKFLIFVTGLAMSDLFFTFFK